MIDLHMHSYFSDDGQFSEEELVLKCKNHGIQVMAISDHDSLKANLKGQEIAKREGLKYMNGMEVSVEFKAYHFHLLAYGFKSHPELEKYENDLRLQNKSASKKRMELVQALGFDIEAKDMKSVEKEKFPGCWAGEMFAEVLMQDERYLSHPLLEPYREGNARSVNPYVNFYWDYFSQGKACYADVQLPQMEDVIETIHRHGGIAVLAHPAVNFKACPHLIDELLSLDLDGIEVCSSYHNQEETDEFYDYALKYQLMMTCGSDYHGKIKPAITLGGFLAPSACSLDDYWQKLALDLKEKKLI